MKVIKEHDIIKVNNELLHVLKASNNGLYLCKIAKGALSGLLILKTYIYNA